MTSYEYDDDGNVIADSIPDEDFEKTVKVPKQVEAVKMRKGFVVETMENKRGEKLYGDPGDYLMRGVEGELYPCDKEVFEQTYRPDCKCSMRTFHFMRTEDASGTSGEGIVAEGVQFADGSVMLHWFNEDNDGLETTSDGFSFKPGPDGAEDTVAVHGHGGRTQIVWHD